MEQRGNRIVGKLTFLIIQALPKKKLGEEPIELPNHCHGKRPEISTNGYSSTWTFITILKAMK
jgi:hypothetical protein